MRTPNLCAAVLVRDSETLDRAFQEEASYLHNSSFILFFLLHRYALGQVAGLIDVPAQGRGNVIGHELQGNYGEQGA